MNNDTRGKRGLTLIELLIVVAIVGILSAIAVPNFLEAQTRAKVSSAHSDLRTVALALECYAVDNNAYPYAEIYGATPWLIPAGFPHGSTDKPGGLTTPIAYLTTGADDPFVHPVVDPSGNITGERAELYYERAGFGYVNGKRLIPLFVPVAEDVVGSSRIDGIGKTKMVTNPNHQPRAWVLWSVGPDLDLYVYDENRNLVTNSRFHIASRYDPTNGTVSPGNILRFPGGENFPR